MEAAVKTWLITLIQSLIAAAGLAAYFYADNVLLAGLAAGSATAIGIVQPLMGARQEKKREPCEDAQPKETLRVISDHVDDVPDDTPDNVIPPPFPHRPTVAAFLEMAALGNPRSQLRRYDDLVDAIRGADEDCREDAETFSAELTGNVLGVAMEGLAALAMGDLNAARRFFEEATQLNSSWVMPWLGWATVCYEQQDYATLATEHPHINGVELLCYDCGDEEIFMELSETQRESLSELYQQTATALGNYYAAAEMAKSRENHVQPHEEMRRVA